MTGVQTCALPISLRCLSCIAAVVALFASTAGVCRRTGRWFAAMGLLFGIPAALLCLASDPMLTGAVGVPAAVIGFAITQWR